MLKKQIFIVPMLFFSLGLLATETDPELFRITPKDDGMITKEFIAALRAKVGDEKASFASQEMEDFAWSWIGGARTTIENEDRKCDYINYLDRLYDKALRAAAQGLSPQDRAELLRKEADWKKTDAPIMITASATAWGNR